MASGLSIWDLYCSAAGRKEKAESMAKQTWLKQNPARGKLDPPSPAPLSQRLDDGYPESDPKDLEHETQKQEA